IGIERDATSSNPMLIATETRNAAVHGPLRKPSTKRSDVVKPTSNIPPTTSHNQGMTFLSLDETGTGANLPRHGGTQDHRQHRRAVALPAVPRGADRWSSLGQQLVAQPRAQPDGRVRHRGDPVPPDLRTA